MAQRGQFSRVVSPASSSALGGVHLPLVGLASKASRRGRAGLPPVRAVAGAVAPNGAHDAPNLPHLRAGQAHKTSQNASEEGSMPSEGHRSRWQSDGRAPRAPGATYRATGMQTTVQGQSALIARRRFRQDRGLCIERRWPGDCRQRQRRCDLPPSKAARRLCLPRQRREYARRGHVGGWGSSYLGGARMQDVSVFSGQEMP